VADGQSSWVAACSPKGNLRIVPPLDLAEAKAPRPAPSRKHDAGAYPWGIKGDPDGVPFFSRLLHSRSGLSGAALPGWGWRTTSDHDAFADRVSLSVCPFPGGWLEKAAPKPTPNRPQVLRITITSLIGRCFNALRSFRMGVQILEGRPPSPRSPRRGWGESPPLGLPFLQLSSKCSNLNDPCTICLTPC
jgi:hypothetical protein